MATDAEVLERQARAGWLLPYLIALDSLTFANPETGEVPEDRPGNMRWAYWLWIYEHNRLPQEPIPELVFLNRPRNKETVRAVKDWLSYPLSHYGLWYDEGWLRLVDWLLYGFGVEELGPDVARIPEDVRAFWYRTVDLRVLLLEPCDWSAFVLQGGLDTGGASKWAKTSGFFSTPMNVATAMAMMAIPMTGKAFGDTRSQSVLDPCCGTGTMLLAASNYSLVLFGQDIVPELVRCAMLNGYLFAPWLVWMTERHRRVLSEHRRLMKALERLYGILTEEPIAGPTAPDDDLVTGVEVSDNMVTRSLAEDRARQAEEFYRAARDGGLEQYSLWEGE